MKSNYLNIATIGLISGWIIHSQIPKSLIKIIKI